MDRHFREIWHLHLQCQKVCQASMLPAWWPTLQPWRWEWKCSWYSMDCMESYPRRQNSSGVLLKKKRKLHGLSPRANYTDRATAACRRSVCQLLRIKGATWSAWRIPTAVFSFSRQEPLLFYQVAPQLYSRGWVDPVPDPLLFFLVVPGIEPGPPDL
jgi:hypothetical protein